MYQLVFLLLLVFQLQLNARHLFYANDDNNQHCSNELLCNKNLPINRPNKLDIIYSENKAICEACDFAIPIIQKLIAANKTEHFQSILTFVCIEFNLADRMVCELFVKEKEVKNMVKF